METLSVSIDKVFPRSEQSPADQSVSLTMLQSAVHSGTASTTYPVGTEIPDIWRDSNIEKLTNLETKYDATWIVAHHGAIIPIGTLAPRPVVYLISKFAHEPTRLNNTDRRTPIESYFDSKMHKRFNSKDSSYINGCSDELLKTVSPIAVTSAITDAGHRNYTNWMTCQSVRFFIPSLGELGFDQRYAPKYEGTPWDLFQHYTPIFTDHDGKPCSYWTRTLDPTERNQVWCIAANGTPFSAQTFASKHLIVACAIM